MSKIYNEIVIDMNPESPTFEETLYEDSFDYEGDMMLMEGEELWYKTDTGGYIKYGKVGDVWAVTGGGEDQFKKVTNPVMVDEHISGKKLEGDYTYEALSGGGAGGGGTGGIWTEGKELSEIDITGLSRNDALNKIATEKYGWNPTGGKAGQDWEIPWSQIATDLKSTDWVDPMGTETDWGAENITADMFIDEQGNQRSVEEVYKTLDPILTGITGKKLVNYINELFPKYAGVPVEEKEAVQRGYESDVYALSKDATKVKQPVYGGMGTTMRGQIAGQQDVKKEFKEIGEERDYDIYGLAKTAKSDLESGILTSIGTIGTPFADVGTEGETSEWGTFMREGGKVPSRGETFLHFLTQLPDAGGT